MSRLVDVDELIKNIKSYTGVFNNEGYYTRNDLIVKAINKTPIAYDVEAVVSELEDRVKIHAKRQLECEEKQWNYLADQHKYYVRAFDEAIEIIKRGGKK